MERLAGLCAAVFTLAATGLFAAHETVAPKAARSVHLSYISPPASAFYGEVTVQKTVPGSYFEVCGFSGGYFGIQDKGPHNKVGIFSVWDTARGNDPSAVSDKDRVEMLFVGQGVRASRFGGEGTGAHSDFDFDWKVGETCKFYLTATVSGKKTEYAAYIFRPDKKDWMHVATFAAPDGGKELTGLYSFIEDFRRDTKSAAEVRRAKFGNEWVMVKGAWEPVTKARFTASGAAWEAKETINAGVDGREFFLQTGGDTIEETKLHATLERESKDAKPPDVPTAE